MNKETIQFFRFLKDNDAYQAFIHRFHRHFMREPDYFKSRVPINYLIGAFTWDNNVNWGRLHAKWFEFLFKKN